MEWSDIAKGLGFTGGGALGGLGINWMLGNTSKKSKIIAALLGAGAGAGAWGLGHLDKDLSGDKDPLTRGDAEDIVERGEITDAEIARAKANPDSQIAEAALDVATDQKDLKRVDALKFWAGNPDYPILSAIVEPIGTTVAGTAIGDVMGRLSGRPNVPRLTQRALNILGQTNSATARNAFSYMPQNLVNHNGYVIPNRILRFLNPEVEIVDAKIAEHTNSVNTPRPPKSKKSNRPKNQTVVTFDEDTMAKAFDSVKAKKGRRIGGTLGLALGLLHGWAGSLILKSNEATNKYQLKNSLKALKEAATK